MQLCSQWLDSKKIGEAALHYCFHDATTVLHHLVGHGTIIQGCPNQALPVTACKLTCYCWRACCFDVIAGHAGHPGHCQDHDYVHHYPLPCLHVQNPADHEHNNIPLLRLCTSHRVLHRLYQDCLFTPRGDINPLSVYCGVPGTLSEALTYRPGAGSSTLAPGLGQAAAVAGSSLVLHVAASTSWWCSAVTESCCFKYWCALCLATLCIVLEVPVTGTKCLFMLLRIFDRLQPGGPEPQIYACAVSLPCAGVMSAATAACRCW